MSARDYWRKAFADRQRDSIAAYRAARDAWPHRAACARANVYHYGKLKRLLK